MCVCVLPSVYFPFIISSFHPFFYSPFLSFQKSLSSLFFPYPAIPFLPLTFTSPSFLFIPLYPAIPFFPFLMPWFPPPHFFLSLSVFPYSLKTSIAASLSLAPHRLLSLLRQPDVLPFPHPTFSPSLLHYLPSLIPASHSVLSVAPTQPLTYLSLLANAPLLSVLAVQCFPSHHLLFIVARLSSLSECSSASVPTLFLASCLVSLPLC